jgi:hypothetical protein
MGNCWLMINKFHDKVDTNWNPRCLACSLHGAAMLLSQHSTHVSIVLYCVCGWVVMGSVSDIIINPRRMREGYGSRSVCVWVYLLPCYRLHPSYFYSSLISRLPPRSLQRCMRDDLIGEPREWGCYNSEPAFNWETTINPCLHKRALAQWSNTWKASLINDPYGFQEYIFK